MSMDYDEYSRIIDHQHFPDTPESSKSDIHQLLSTTAEDKSNEEKGGSSNMPMASFNYINSIIGSGIVGMPYALRQAGFGMGIILILLVAGVTDYSLVQLIHAGELSNTNTYQEVMRAAFGRSGFIILTIMQLLYPLFALVSYNVVIGDTITKLIIRISGERLRHTIIARREFVIVLVTLLVTLPLSLYKNISRLAKVSLLSILFILFVIASMIGRKFTMTVDATPGAWQFANAGITRAISIIAFAYMCTHNSFMIYDSLIDPTARRWNTMTHLSILVSMICTLILGIVGYTTFTGYSQGDVLENYCYKDDLMNASRFFFACSIMLTYPVDCFVTRQVLENAIFAFVQPPPLWRHVIMTVAIATATALLSMTTDCLGIVFELNGIINAAPLAFIFPVVCVIKLQNEPVLCLQNIPRLAVAIFGVLVAVVGLIMALVEMARGVKCSHGVEMPFCAAFYNDNYSAPLSVTKMLNSTPLEEF